MLQESGISTPPPPPPTTASIPSPPSSPPPFPSATIPQPLRRLLDETSDLIDSPSFSQILTLLLDAAFSHLTDQNIRSQAFKLALPGPLPRIQELHSPRPSTASLSSAAVPAAAANLIADQDLYEPTTRTPQPKTKLATILAVVTRQAHEIGNGVPNEYVQAMEEVRELEAFAAVVYSSHFELGVAGEAGATGPVVPDDRVPGEIATGDRGAEESVLDDAATSRAEQSSMLEQATGMFENVWGKVVKGH